MSDSDVVVATPDTCSGAQRIRGTRLRVSNVVSMLASGMSGEEIVRDYPSLTAEDVRACAERAATK